MRKAEKNCQPAKKRMTRAHIVQSAMAGLYILLVFGAMHSLQNELAVASLGASAFIAFSFPTARSSLPRFLIGGYCVGIACGWLGWGISLLIRDWLPFPDYIPACAMAVFLSMLLMTTLDFEHPPSAALAVAITIDPHPVRLAFAGLACIIVLCIIREGLKKHLRDL